MHVLIATDGSLDPRHTAQIATQLASGDGRITVLTVVEVPRGLLEDIRNVIVDDPPEATGPQYRTTQAETDEPARGWIGDDAVVGRYVQQQVERRTGELAAELESTGVEYRVVGEEGEDAARSIIAAATTLGADVLCIGTHGLGRFDGLLGSTSTKLARRAPCSVVLVR